MLYSVVISERGLTAPICPTRPRRRTQIKEAVGTLPRPRHGHCACAHLPSALEEGAAPTLPVPTPSRSRVVAGHMNPNDPTSTSKTETPAAGPTDSNDPTDLTEMEEGTRLIIYGGMSVVTDDEGAGINHCTNCTPRVICHVTCWRSNYLANILLARST